jgi:hypothetical protein
MQYEKITREEPRGTETCERWTLVEDGSAHVCEVTQLHDRVVVDFYFGRPGDGRTHFGGDTFFRNRPCFKRLKLKGVREAALVNFGRGLARCEAARARAQADALNNGRGEAA